ncbi:MAG: ATP-binding cassette domain-containing protein [Acidimicrobiia bacterium]
MLEVEALTKSYGALLAVSDVSFHIGPGETYGLLGPNGAGKTTTISMVAGLLERDAGEVRVDGEPLDTHTVAAKANLGLVPQELAIYPDLSGRENLRFFGRLYGLGGTDLARRVDEVLEVIGLADRACDRTETYSGGMKRRLNIGIGLLHSPKLLLLDEPTVGVDPQSRNAILTNVEELSGGGIAILYTTHYMEEAERLCDRVGILDEGEIKAEGTRRELVDLIGQRDTVRMAITGATSPAAQAVARVPGVEKVSEADGSIELVIDDARSRLPELIRVVGQEGSSVSGVEVTEPNLEAVFLHLTGKALRD